MELRHGAVVAALLLVPLAAGLPTAGSTSPPAAGGGRPSHAGPRDWGSWPPPYEDEEDDEDGFLGPRALPLEAGAGASAPGDLVPQDSDVDSEILAEYVREVAASRAAAGHTSVPAPQGESAPGDQPAPKTLTTRDVSNATVVDAVSSSHLNNSGSSDSVRESKSFSSSVAPASVPLVKPLKAEPGHNAVDAEGKAGPARDRVETSLPAVPALESTTAAVESAAAARETESSEKRVEPQASGATVEAEAEAAPQGGSNASQPGGVAPSVEMSSPQPADVDATAPAEAASEAEAGPDVSSSPPPEEEAGWTAYDASAAADDDVDVVGQQEEAVPQSDLRSRTAEREAAEEEDVPEADAPVSRGRVAPAAPPPGAMDAASITGIALGIVVFSSLVGAVSFVMYRRRYLNKPQTLNDKCSNPDSSGYIDDSTLRENSEEMYSLDNDSFLNSLEAMTIQNYWTDSVKHTKL